MIIQINGKSLLECNEEEIQSIKDDPAFKESHYIDYKGNFSFIKISDKNEREKKKVEFRNDICSFANAEGGYILYGIKESQGIPVEINGITIPNDNTDKFELDLRNALSPIEPRVPYVKFNFIKLLSGNYVVIIYISHDLFAPYTHIENQINYKFFKRGGNEKTTMSYTELKNMFNQSIMLEKEIDLYRKERITYFKEQSENDTDAYSRFVLFHIIPDSFLDIESNKNLYAIEKNDRIRFDPIFSSLYCESSSTPCVDGLKYKPYDFESYPFICSINNNGVSECFISMNGKSFEFDEYYYSYDIWDYIKNTLIKYIKIMKGILYTKKIFACISIVGCKGMTCRTRVDDIRYKPKIDRNLISCTPITIDDISNDEIIESVSQKLYIEYMLSIGIKNDPELNSYIKNISQ